MKKTVKSVLSLVLALTMLLSVSSISVQVFAASADKMSQTGDSFVPEESVSRVNLIGNGDAAYYLVGQFNNWQISERYMFNRVENQTNIEEYRLDNVVLKPEEMYWAICPSNEGTSSTEGLYPGDSDINSLTVSESGIYDLYFRPNGDGNDDWLDFSAESHGGKLFRLNKKSELTDTIDHSMDVTIHVKHDGNANWNPWLWIWQNPFGGNYTGGTWPGVELSNMDEKGWYDYSFEFNVEEYGRGSYCLIVSDKGDVQTADYVGFTTPELWIVINDDKLASWGKYLSIYTQNPDAYPYHAHSYVTQYTTPPTCVDNGYTSYVCTVCGYSYIGNITVSTGHSFGEWKVSDKPTCQTEGTKYRECSVCGEREEDSISQIDHDYEEETVEPSANKFGYTLHTCKMCGKSYKDNYTNPTSSTLPSEAVEYNGHHYLIIYDNVSWPISKANCEDLGGHLATITDASEQSFIEDLNIYDNNLWIGGYREENDEDSWQWVTGEKWDYTNWNSGEPNNNENETCAAIWPAYWNDLHESSDEQEGYICEWDEPETLSAPVEFNGHYYKAYINSNVTWETAKLRCEKMGGHLATVTSAEEQALIESISDESFQYWLGGTDKDDEGSWRWITDEEWSYTNWADGQPDNEHSFSAGYIEEGENCLAYRVNSGWYDVCNDYSFFDNTTDEQTIAFICEWDSEPETYIPPSTCTNHDFGEWIVDKKPTIYHTGLHHHICQICGVSEKEEIPITEIDIENSTDYGLALFSVADAQTKEPIKDAGIFISIEEEGETTLFTDENGAAQVVMPVGKQQISVYSNGCLTRSLKISIKPGVNNLPKIGLSGQKSYSAQLTHHLMSLEEIEEAGIDIYNPENNHLYKYELRLDFVPEIDWLSIVYYFDDFHNFYPGPDVFPGPEPETGHEEGGKSSKREAVWIPGGGGEGEEGESSGYYFVSGGDDEDSISIYPVSEYFYLIIRGEVRWLKEMFDVEMLIINNSMTDTLDDLTATLSLPNGLSLAAMKDEQQTPEQHIDHIPEGESRSVHWYVRGDSAGDYNLTARLQGMIMPFEEEIDDLFVSSEALHVWAGNALKLHFEFPGVTYYNDDYPITITLTNVSDRTLYNLTHAVQIEEGMSVTYSDGTHETRIEKSQWAKYGAMEFNPGDKLIIHADVNIFFKSEIIKNKLEQIADMIDGFEQLVNSFRAIETVFDVAVNLTESISGCSDAIDNYLKNGNLSESTYQLFSSLRSSISSLIDACSDSGNKAMDAAVKLENTGLDEKLKAITNNPEEWFASASEEEIKSLSSNINSLKTSVVADATNQARFDVFDSIRTAISSLPVRFVLTSVKMTEDPSNTTSIPWSYTVTDSSSRYSGVLNYSQYLHDLAFAAADQIYNEGTPQLLRLIPGFDDPFAADEAIRRIKATENEMKHLLAVEASGNVSFTAWIERSGQTGSNGQQAEIELSVDDETAQTEDGVITFSGDSVISIEPKSSGTATLHIEDSEGGKYTYLIETVEQHECHAGESEIMVPPTDSSDGFAVKRCETCGDVLEVIPLYSSDKCSRHAFGDWETDVEATCVEQGMSHRECSVCGYTEYHFDSAKGHTPGEWTVTEKPDNDKDGKRVRVCTVCGEVVDSEIIPKIISSVISGDVNGDGTVDSADADSLADYIGGDQPLTNIQKLAADVNSDGKISSDDLDALRGYISGTDPGTAIGNEAVKQLIPGDFDGNGTVNISDATEMQKFIAKICDSTEGNMILSDLNGDGIINIMDVTVLQKYIAGLISEITVSNAAIKPYAIISVCSSAEMRCGEALALTADVLPEGLKQVKLNWSSDNEDIATVSSDGVVTAHSEGNAKITVSAENKSDFCDIVVLPHQHHYSPAETVSPTCTEKGYTVYICSGCGDEYRSDYTDVIDHQYVEVADESLPPSCTDSGFTLFRCPVCGDEYTEEHDALGHDYTKETFSPTCTNKGYSLFSCSRCGDQYSGEYTDATGHSYEVVAGESSQPSCTEAGHTLYRCSLCGDEYTEEHDALGHNYSAAKTIDSTCTEQGYTVYRCSRCNDEYHDDFTDPTGHKYDRYVGHLDPTCRNRGGNLYTCSVCGEGQYCDESEDKVSHRFEDGACIWCGLEQISLTNCTATVAADDFVCDGTEKRPEVTVKNGGELLEENKDYTLEYADNIYDGTAKVIIRGINLYKDQITKYFYIAVGTLGKTGDCFWSFDKNTGTLTVSGNGRMKDSYSPWKSLPVTHAVIENGVKSVGSSAFADCTALADVQIADSVTVIGSSAFSNCKNLTEIYIPKNVSSILVFAFSGCTRLGSITIDPDNTVFDSRNNCNAIINSSSNELIAGCKNTVIPDGVTSIKEYSFYNCKGLSGIAVPDSVINIGESAFSGCTDLTNAIIGNGVSKIKTSTFYNCTSLRSITVGSGVTEISSSAFYNCTNLNAVNISDIAAWNNIKFEAAYCNPLYYAHNLYLDNVLLTDLTIPDDITSINNYAFYGCTSIERLTTGDNLKSIGKSAFENCSGLTSVTIGGNVTDIGNSAFSGCSKLEAVNIGDIAAWCGINFENSTSNPLYYAKHLYLNNNAVNDLVIPDGVTSIGSYAFYNCENITSAVIPDGITEIGDYVFYNCTSLADISIPDSVTKIGNSAFYRCLNLSEGYLPEGVTSIGNNAFAYCFEIVDLTLPDSATDVGEYAFCHCYNLENVKIPDSVTSIGQFAFCDCTKLKSVTIPASSESIGEKAFGYYRYYSSSEAKKIENFTIYGEAGSAAEVYASDNGFIFTELQSVAGGSTGDCTWLLNNNGTLIISGSGSTGNYNSASDVPWYGNRSDIKYVIVESGVTDIRDYAFWDCSNLKSITIPGTLTSIGDSAFYHCTAMNAVFISDIAAWCNIEFTDYDSNPLIYAGNLYLNNAPVKNLVIPDTVTSISDYAFYKCSSLKSVTITDGVTNTGNSSFRMCNNLESVVIGSGITDIEKYSFDNCSNLTSVVIGNGTKSIGFNAFNNCRKLSSIVIPDSVETIDTDALKNTAWYDDCPDGQVYAGKVFYKYKGEMPENTSVELAEGTKSISSYAFDGCTGLLEITIPDSVTEIGSRSFYGCTSLTSVTIPDGVTAIDYYAFYGCTSLEAITIPDSVTHAGASAFNNTPWYNNLPDGMIYIGKVAFKYKGTMPEGTSIELAEGTTEIADNAFSDCTGLTSVSVPVGVTSIGSSAFEGCTNLTELTMPYGVTSIGSYAFNDCAALESVTIPDSVTDIGTKSFGYYNRPGYYGDNDKVYNFSISGYAGTAAEEYANANEITFSTIMRSGTAGKCSWVYDSGKMTVSGNGGMGLFPKACGSVIVEAVIEDGVTAITSSVFNNCKYLSTITIPDSVTSIDGSAFYGTAWFNNQPDGMVYAGKVAYCYKGIMPENTAVDIQDGTKGLSDYIFYNCTGLVSVTIPDSVTNIGDYAFYNCSYLTDLEIPDSVTSIGYDAFSCCASLTDITIPENVRSIGSYAFSDCTNLAEVTISEGITSIGNYAFYRCPNLTEVTIPDSVTSIGTRALGYYYSNGYKKYADFTISGHSGSAAEVYANSNGFSFKNLDE